MPWSVKSPLLLYIGIFTAATYQAATQKISPARSPVVLRYKVKSIELLNEMLSNEDSATCTEAMAAVMFLITSEWYWGNHEVVENHMKGLKEMIRIRGSLDDLGMKGFLRKMVIQYVLDISFHTLESPF